CAWTFPGAPPLSHAGGITASPSGHSANGGKSPPAPSKPVFVDESRGALIGRRDDSLLPARLTGPVNVLATMVTARAVAASKDRPNRGRRAWAAGAPLFISKCRTTRRSAWHDSTRAYSAGK